MKQGIKIIILTTLISCSLKKHQDDILLIKSDTNVNETKIFEDKIYDQNILWISKIDSTKQKAVRQR